MLNEKVYLFNSLFFFWGKSSGLEADWTFVCEYLISFLYDDEISIVINPNSQQDSQQVLILGVHGYVAIGHKRA